MLLIRYAYAQAVLFYHNIAGVKGGNVRRRRDAREQGGVDILFSCEIQEAGGAPLPPRPVAHRGRRPAALSAGERRYPMCKEVTFVYLVVDRLGPCGKNEAARFDNWSDALAFVEKAEQAGLPWAQDLEIIDVTDNDALAI